MKWFLVCLILLSPVPAYSQSASLASEDAARNLSNQIMGRVISGNVSDALDLARPYFVGEDYEFDALNRQLDNQLSGSLSNLGKTVGQEFLCKERLGKSITKFYFLQKMEKSAVSWTFYFYKPRDRWVMVGIHYTSNLYNLYCYDETDNQSSSGTSPSARSL